MRVRFAATMSHLIRFLAVAAAVLVLLTLLTWRRVYVVSPSGRQTITFFQPCTLPFSGNGYYLLPYRYEGWTAPAAGYVLVEPRGEGTLLVNWDSEEGHRLKLHLTGRVLANTLDPARAVYAAAPNGYLDRNETYFYPKYGSYMFEHILDKNTSTPSQRLSNSSSVWTAKASSWLRALLSTGARMAASASIAANGRLSWMWKGVFSPVVCTLPTATMAPPLPWAYCLNALAGVSACSPCSPITATGAVSPPTC